MDGEALEALAPTFSGRNAPAVVCVPLAGEVRRSGKRTPRGAAKRVQGRLKRLAERYTRDALSYAQSPP